MSLAALLDPNCPRPTYQTVAHPAHLPHLVVEWERRMALRWYVQRFPKCPKVRALKALVYALTGRQG